MLLSRQFQKSYSFVLAFWIILITDYLQILSEYDNLLFKVNLKKRYIKMRKTGKFVRAITLILMMAILISVAMPIVASASNPFTDIQPGAWHHDYVTWANTNGITGGTTATTFSPADNVTRAQFVTFLWRMSGSPDATATHNFTDVATGTWFTTAVAWAHAEGVSGGTSPTTFSPHDDVTRQQIATMLFNFLPSPANAPTDAVDRFTDSERIAPWAQYGMRWAAHREIMGRGLDALTPGYVASRAHTVAMLYRVARTYNLDVGTAPVSSPAPPSPTPTPKPDFSCWIPLHPLDRPMTDTERDDWIILYYEFNNEFPSILDEELRFIDLLNELRISEGLYPVILYEPLMMAARYYAGIMNFSGLSHHIGPYGGSAQTAMAFSRHTNSHLRTGGGNGSSWGSATGAFTGWSRSPGHRLNMLQPSVTHIGFGIFRGTSYMMIGVCDIMQGYRSEWSEISAPCNHPACNP